MTQYQVTCINKPNHNSSHEHITHIGGGIGNGRWLLTREEAIRQIELNISSFYVKDSYSGKISWVKVVHRPFGHSYLQTQADGLYNNNLLSLSECPVG
jgi:Protein of unknown function (DUF3892)